MRKIVLALLAVFILTCFDIHAQSKVSADQLYNLSQVDATDKMIAEQSRKLDSLIVATPVWLSDNVATQYDPLFGLIINKKNILKLAQDTKLSDISNLFFMILAHEKMHALQFIRLQNVNRNFNSLTTEEMQWLECQADMCAGYLVLFPRIQEFAQIITKALVYSYRQMPQNKKLKFIPFADLTDGDLSTVFSWAKKNKEGLNLFFTIGDKEGIFGTHPNPVSRKIAFEMGLDAFTFAAMQVPLPASLTNTITPHDLEFLKGAYASLMYTLAVFPTDYQMGNFFELWSARVSSKIIHFEDKASNNIVFRVKKNRWDTSINNPFLYFEIEISNKNPDSVLVDLDVPIKTVSKKDPEDPLKSSTVTSYHNLILLAPGEKKNIADSVMWVPATDSTMPRVYYPGEEGSLYKVLAFHPKDPRFYLPLAMAGAPTLFLLNDRQLRKLSGLLHIIQEDFKANDINYFKTGAGLIWEGENEVQYNWYKGSDHYILHVPEIKTQAPYLTLFIGKFQTLTDLKDQYKDIQKQLANEYSIDLKLIEDQYSSVVFIRRKDNNRIIGYLSAIKNNSEYVLNLNLYKEQ